MHPTNGHSKRAAVAKALAAQALSADRHVAAVDVVLFTIQEGSLRALLVQRPAAPYAGAWSLPGGFVRKDESVDEAALRELQEETGITTVYLEQLYTFGDLDRDPRGRVIAVTYYAPVNWEQVRLKALPRQRNARWFPIKRLPELAFDHRKIIAAALERLRNKVNYTSIAFQLLPKKFTLSELQRAYEVVLDQTLDKRNFRKKMLQLGVLKDTGEQQIEGRQRPARLYSFTDTRVIKLQEKGIIVPF